MPQQMTNDETVAKLIELSAQREEHFQKLESLLSRSEERIDRTQSMIRMLIEAIADAREERRAMRDGYEKRIGELNELLRLERDREQEEHDQNDTLVKQNI